jgi:hypothetical protein
MVDFGLPDILGGAGRSTEKPPPCSHKRQNGFPCAQPICVRGTNQRELKRPEGLYRRGKTGKNWVWNLVPGK